MNKETRELLEQHFDTAFDAPDGIKKLRELILTLAMQGKLVPQNPDDQPASELLKEIEAEKKRLIKEGKIKPQKPLPPIKPEEIPYEIPKSWKWVRLGTLIDNLLGGGTPSKNNSGFWNGGIPWASVKDLNVDIYLEKTVDSITQTGLEKSNTNLISAGNIIVCTRMGLGKICINRIDVAINQDLKALFLNSRISKLFFINKFKNYSIVGKGVTVKGIKQDELLEFLFPLPPVKEQQWIVEKIDALMARVDELERLRNERDEKRLKIHKAAIDRLLSAKSDADFAEAWRFITGNFNSLYSVKENVAELRKAILQLAVMGKFSKSLDTDSPVLSVLEKIIGEIKNDKEIKTSEKELTISLLNESKKKVKDNRVMLKTRVFCSFITKGTTPKTGELLESGEIPFLKVYNIVNNRIDFEYKPAFVSDNTHNTKLKRSKIFPGDVIMNIVGPPLGKVAIIPSNYPEWNMNQALAFFRPRANIYNRYVYHVLTTPSILKSAIREVKGTAGQDNLSLEQCRDIEIPIPPIEEQHRIVEKVDQLMALCDGLEQNLAAAAEKQAGLLNSLMAKV